MNIKANISVDGKFKRKVFVLCGFSINKMAWLWQSVSVFVTLMFFVLESYIGKGYYLSDANKGFIFIMALSFFHYADELGKFLLALHLNATKE